MVAEKEVSVRRGVAEKVSLAEAYARELFLEDPSLSIDAAARTVSDRFRGGIHKSILSGIRREVQQAIDSGHAKTQPTKTTVYRPRQPFNPPRIRSEEVSVTPAFTPASEKPTPSDASSARSDRKRFAEEWSLDHPEASVSDLRRAVTDRFGMAMATAELASILRLARNLHRESKAPSLPQHRDLIVPVPGYQPPRSVTEVLAPMASVKEPPNEAKQQEAPKNEPKEEPFEVRAQKLIEQLLMMNVRSLVLNEDRTAEVTLFISLPKL